MSTCLKWTLCCSRVTFRGFTLIELLIVVAIIAILPAIAVPNFLEAQIRAKVGRVKSDLRTLATGLEAYMNDELHYPNDPFDTAPSTDVRELKFWSQLTTPIAFMTSIPTDPFREKREEGSYLGVHANYYIPHTTKLYRSGWRSSGGPEDVDYVTHVFGTGVEAWDAYSVGPDGMHFSPAGPGGSVISNSREYTVYDPSNGTISAGNVICNSRNYRMN